MRNQWEIENAFATRDELDQFRSFYLVGIGGASMSALAKMLLARGFTVAGSDSTASPVTAELMSEGISIRIGHDGEGVKKGDAIILTDAIDLKASPEVARARDLGCSLFRRSQLLGWLLKGRRVIAVTGTHGKTTTTGLVSFALIEAGFDPLCIEGANIPQWGGPVRYGEGDWAVIEACEAYDSLRDFDPEIVVLTNLELDHEDFYTGGWEQLKETMLRFVNRAKTLVYCTEDPGASELASGVGCRAIGYRTDPSDPTDLEILGSTNALNAAGALSAALMTGADEALARRGMAKFTGAERRLQSIHSGAIHVIDDYAHHPSEIIASLGAIRERFFGRRSEGEGRSPHPPAPSPSAQTSDREGEPGRLIVVFQPHLYSRTAAHLDDFAKALSLADHVVLTDIYPAREEPIPGVSSARIAEKITKPVTYVPSRHLLPRAVLEIVRQGDVVVGMGAGNISEFASAFVEELKRAGLGSDAYGRPSTPNPSPRRGEGNLRIAVVYGGDSAEREVSLLSGRCVRDALSAKGHDAYLVDVSELLLSTGDLGQFVGSRRPDVAFLAVHGTNAEDGSIQGLFELLHIPYTGSKIQSSAIAMDKERTKQILRASGLPVPKGFRVEGRGSRVEGVELPVVVKPNEQGSTVGVSFVFKEEDLASALEKALQYDNSVLVEELIEGTEISVPVLGDRALPPVEIVPVNGTYDFESKYTPGATEEICPARLDPEVYKRAQEYAHAAHQALGCEGATRTDMIVRDQDCIILEVNTLPGMTGTSLLPNSAKAAGISFEELCDWIVQDALKKNVAKT
jgi:D-alanine--D-alanine ligase